MEENEKSKYWMVRLKLDAPAVSWFRKHCSDNGLAVCKMCEKLFEKLKRKIDRLNKQGQNNNEQQ